MAKETCIFDKKEIVRQLIQVNSKILFQQADRVRQAFCGEGIYLRGIIEFSNYCRCDCLYCGLRKSNKRLHRYRMPLEEIFQTAKKAKTFNCKTVVLQSGEDIAYKAEDLYVLIKKIKKELNLAVTLSIGERSRQEYEMMKKAGADRYLLKHETANPVLYKKLHPDSSFAERLRRLQWLKELGYQVGTGCMVGLPGQSVDDLAEDILLFKELDADMIGIGPFIPHPDTPLGNAKGGDLNTVLKVLAITRIVTKNTHLPATTAVGTIDPLGRQKALQCGANVLMPNITPQKYRKDYQIYPGKICIFENAEKMVKSLGRTIASGFGHSLKKENA